MEYSDIIREIRQEYARVETQYIPSAVPPAAPRTALYPGDEASVKDSYYQLISLETPEFARKCYKLILQRDVDPSGLRAFSASLEKGKLTRDDLILLLQASEESKGKNVYIPDVNASAFHLKYLLRFDGEEFVDHAYQWILGRNPDSRGRQEFLSLLASGKLGKAELAASLRNSAEGKDRNVTICGLGLYSTVSRVQRILHIKR